MWRSQEIILTLSVRLPPDIINYILSIERNILFERNIYQWIYFSELFHNEKSKRFFHHDLKNIFLKEIKDIGGNFVSLKKHKLKSWNFNYKNKIDSLYLNTLRY
jgi:hypothetical protein